uniref:Aminotransferase class I/classII domain-containing protein n=1 Tax=Ditylenchus dipsaci TaxID=166011 RepID=A0A915E975_9BILA
MIAHTPITYHTITAQNAGTFKTERVILGRQDIEISVDGCENKLLNFCSNNYLGLSSHPEVIKAGKRCLDTHGAGLSSVRFISEFHGREDAILYGSCFDANAGIFEVITNKEDVIISDELNHASLIDGIRLSKAQRLRYKHMDMEDLEAQLKQTKNHRRRIV